jgi:hypothetical protein
MNSHPRAGRRRLATAAVTAASLLGVLVLVTGCGSSSNTDTAASADRKQALEYARCMRDNGVPDFPDPDPNGRFSGVGHEQQDNPDFIAAQEACRDLAPGGEHERLGDPAFVAQMREFSRCMRANGVPDFPDPDPDGRLRGAGHEQRNDPQYQAAAETCRSKLPGGGEHGG